MAPRFLCPADMRGVLWARLLTNAINVRPPLVTDRAARAGRPPTRPVAQVTASQALAATAGSRRYGLGRGGTVFPNVTTPLPAQQILSPARQTVPAPNLQSSRRERNILPTLAPAMSSEWRAKQLNKRVPAFRAVDFIVPPCPRAGSPHGARTLSARSKP